MGRRIGAEECYPPFFEQWIFTNEVTTLSGFFQHNIQPVMPSATDLIGVDGNLASLRVIKEITVALQAARHKQTNLVIACALAALFPGEFFNEPFHVGRSGRFSGGGLAHVFIGLHRLFNGAEQRFAVRAVHFDPHAVAEFKERCF